MRTRWALLGLVVCCLTQESQAQIPVTDAGAIAKSTAQFFWTQAHEVKKYAEMVTTAQQMVEQVKGTYRMIEMASKNLANMPTDGNILNWVSQMDGQTSALLGQVQHIGFNLDRTTRQFEALYGNTAMLLTPEGRAERYRQMQAARLEMTGIAMQTQSIRQTFSDLYTRLATLVGISSWAEGTKAMQQLQMQQHSLAQQQQQLGLTMQAVTARLAAMQQAEEMVLQQMRLTAAHQDAMAWYARQPVALPEGFNGFMIRPQ